MASSKTEGRIAADAHPQPPAADIHPRLCLSSHKAPALLPDDGVHTAVLIVRAEVCLHCGERLYDADTIKRFEDIREKLRRQETDEFQPMGQTFHVA